MNQGIFRLVFSKVLNMYVPASEAVKTKTCKSSGKRVRGQVKKVFVVGLASTVATSAWSSELELIGAKNATAQAIANGMIIHQNKAKAILDWSKLNLSKGDLLHYDQQGNRSWSALNRIHDLSPSLIDGNVIADGNVYFINANGIIFGKNSQVNVGSLYAGSLDITDDLFNNGLLSDPNSPVFSGTGGFALVEEGAQIFAASGGRVILLAPTVTNNGLINTPDGQTILAAGNKVYLQSITTDDIKDTSKPQYKGEDPAHLLVEVDSGGTATNLGKIIADRGNVTLVGLAVNQQGTISASTSVRANGTVKLLARDTVSHPSGTTGTQPLVATRGGTVTLGKDSVTEVRVEMDDKEEITGAQLDVKPFNKSRVAISGKNVDVEGKILAQGGNVEIQNDRVFSDGTFVVSPIKMERVYLGQNSVIDVSGVDATAPMDRNQLEIQLFSDQLKDVPLLRDTGLYKQKVYVDKRKGTSLTDITPFVKLKGQTVAELMTEGGQVSFAGEVIQRAGSVVDVSGGTTTYLPGTIRETVLNYNGKVIPISEINPETTIPAIGDKYTTTDKKWGVTREWDLTGGSTKDWGKTVDPNNKTFSILGSVHAGYKEGENAGEISNADSATGNGVVVSAFTVMDGTILANTYVGETQHLTQSLPLGGKIALTGDFSSVGDVLADDFRFDSVLTQNGLRKLNVSFLDNGFNRVTLTGEVNTKLNVKPKGTVVLDAAINADVIAPGSDITILPATEKVADVTVSTGARIADGVTISSAGLFTNDTPGVSGASAKPVVLNAGNINAATKLGKNVTLDASAGAWLDGKGELHKGQAGDITLSQAQEDSIGEGSQLKAYGFDKGGELKVVTGNKVNPLTSVISPVNINIAGTPDFGDLYLGADFFRQGGFSKYTLSANGGDVTIGNGSVVDIYSSMQTLQLNSGYQSLASGSSISFAVSPWLAPEYQRQASSVVFSAYRDSNATGNLTLNENATIHTDTGGKVTLEATRRLAVLGDITTPAGEINVKLRGDLNTVPYDPANAIFIGENAHLSAKGVYREIPANNGVLNAEVLNGGSINVEASVGAVVAKEGSMLDVSAASGATDRQLATGYRREVLYGDAGSISFNVRNSLLLDGDLKAGVTGTGRGGSLKLATNSEQKEVSIIAPTAGVDFRITQDKQLTTQGLNPGDAVMPAASSDAEILALKGKAQISAEQITQGGFDRVTIENNFGQQIALDAGTNLTVPGTLTLQARQLSVTGDGNANVNANYVALKQDDSNRSTAPVPANTEGNNSLNINADQIGIAGQVAVNNVNHTTLNAKLDINGGGRVDSSGAATVDGGLTTAGDLDLTARNIYPNTGNKLKFEAVGSDKKITVNKNSAPAKTVLSAQGELTLKADYIEQNGTLRAPFGVINLEAAKLLTLGDGSLTTVSADGKLIPFGSTRLSGQEYQSRIYANDGEGTNPKLTAKAINLKSDKIDQKSGSKVDLSGGGDMFAYEWIQGIGGSKDVLAQPGYYAVLPSLGKDFAPTDSVYQKGSDLNVGDAVYLTGIEGLASGTYTLLPARYALMPGAFLVQAGVKSQLLPNQTAKQIDGTTLTTGYRETLGTGGHDANWSTFKVVSGDILRPAAGTVSKSPSEYLITKASDFFGKLNAGTGAQQQLPQDAGQLSLSAKTELDLDGDIVANKGAGAHGALVDIASENIRVVSSVDSGTGALQLEAAKLNKLNAESILLGGTRSIGDTSTDIAASSKTVTIENNAASALTTSEFMATATDMVTVKSGAVINTGNAPASTNKSNITTSGDGTLLAVSSINDITYSRANASKNPTQGTLNIEAGSTINAGKSLVIDSTKDSKLEGTVKVAEGGSATFGANTILLGNPSPAVVGLNVSNQTLADLGKLSKFTLNSGHNVDIYGAVDFGNADLDLTVNSAGLAGHLAAGETVNITARNLEIKNATNAAYTDTTAASDSQLNITAANVKLTGKDVPDTGINSGKTKLSGFAKVDVNANELRVAKTGETAFDTAQTNLNTGRVTADTGAEFKLAGKGNLAIAQLATPIASSVSSAPAEGVGAKLAIEANNLNVGSKIELAAGNVSLTSKAGDLIIATGANVSAKSIEETFYDKTVATPAGTVSLVSEKGNVNVNTGAVVDVSSLDGANAGSVNIVATNGTTGTANISGELKGSAGADASGKVGTGGRLSVDVDKLSDITTTNKHATGFSESRQYRVRQDNVAITGTGADAIKAREVVVAADNGNINVTGDIDASSAKNGYIALLAKNEVTLENTAKLAANSTQAGAQGGTVEINTVDGNLDLKANSKIDVSGGAGGEGGEVYLRAKRNAANTDINISHADSDFVGAKSVRAEGFKTYDQTTLTAANMLRTGTYYSEAANFESSVIAGNGVGLDRLKPNSSVFTIVPGIEVKGANDMSFASDWSLYDWRFDPTTGAGVTNTDTGLNASGKALLAGVLTIRTERNLNINGTLNDGFKTSSLTTADNVGGYNSWSYNLIAGADSASSNVLATKPLTTTTGNLNLANAKGIRTGKGDIHIATSGNLNMGNNSSVIYTAGRKAGDLAGFDTPTDATLKPLYLTDGGDISLRVKGDIVGKEGTTNRQLINNWLFRVGGGSNNLDTTWWVRPDLFKQSLATLGGGDANITVGGNISDFSASLPTTARYDSNGITGNSRVDGGGDLTINAGGNINNGVYFVAKGEGNISSGGSIQQSGNTFGTVLAIQDGKFNVTTAENAYIETVVNPTLLSQTSKNNQLGAANKLGLSAFFSSYSDDAHLNLTSLTGSATFGDAAKFSRSAIADWNSGNDGKNLFPATLNVVALGGDVNVADTILLSAPKGNLNLLAANNIGIDYLSMSDADPSVFPTPLKPIQKLTSIGGEGSSQEVEARSASLLHANDQESAMVIAKNGSIRTATSSTTIPTINLAKSAKIVTGADITNLQANIQNIHASDVTLIKAGNDINGNFPSITVAGPGEVLVEAGRNIDLGQGDGINTIGNKENAALPRDSASITVAAGLGKEGATIDTYIAQYILPSGTGPTTLQGNSSALAEYRKNTTNALTTYMRKVKGDSTLTDEQALTAFNALSRESKTIFAYRHFSGELLASAQGFAKSQNHTRALDAIAGIFPVTNNHGDITLFNSKISTKTNGSIDMIVPNGLVNAGLAGGGTKTDIGIITEQGGAIRAYADTGFMVNQSKVVTQFGSDITIATRHGDIDAGRGSKTATAVPERIVSTDVDGNTTVETRGVAAGSGIRAQTYDPDGKPITAKRPVVVTAANGDKSVETQEVVLSGLQGEPNKGQVALYAIEGKVDAGEAGIEAGDFLAVATQVLGADNISVSGTSQGIPAAASAGIAGATAGLSPDATSSAVQDVANSVAQTASQPVAQPTFPSLISVEIIGIGN